MQVSSVSSVLSAEAALGLESFLHNLNLQIAVEAVANVRTVASLGREDTFIKEYAVLLIPGLTLAKKGCHWRGIVFGLSRGLFNFIIAASLYYGGTLIVDENHSTGYAEVFQ